MIDFLNKLRCLGRRYPSCPEPFLFHAAKIQHLGKNGNPFFSGIITIQVIAFTQASATDKNPIYPALKGEKDMMRRDAATTHNPDGANIRRVLQTTDPSQVSSSICSPGAKKTDHPRFKVVRTHNHSSFRNVLPLSFPPSLCSPGACLFS